MSTASQTVWIEEVDTGLLTLIPTKVLLPNSLAKDTPIPVDVRKPENDFMVEQYPSITIYNLYCRRATERNSLESTVISRDELNHSMVLEKGAIPYDLYYQIDFWAQYQSDMNEMLRQWVANFDRDFNLSVKDKSGTARTVYALQMEDMIQKADSLKGKERLFHSFVTYKVRVEIDESVQTTVPMVTEINITKSEGDL